ncbi:MAG: FecR domain-containing protein [Nitrospirae bacterium]|nr:FecR domain-containing protein [Nitrospirota bacterium]
MRKGVPGLLGLLGIGLVVGIVVVSVWNRSTGFLGSSEKAFLKARDVSDLYSVLMVSGPVRVRAREAVQWRNVSLSTPVYNGEVIETGPGAYVDLLLGQRNYVRIGENTTLEITGRREEGLSRYVMDLAEGKLAVVARFLDGFDLLVATRTAVAGVRGTSFLVEAMRGSTRVSVLEGSVRVASRSAPDRPIVLGPMQEVDVAKDRPPEPRSIPETGMEKLGILERIEYFKPATPDRPPGAADRWREARRGPDVRQEGGRLFGRGDRPSARERMRASRESRLSRREGTRMEQASKREGREPRKRPGEVPAGGAPREGARGAPQEPSRGNRQAAGGTSGTKGVSPAEVETVKTGEPAVAPGKETPGGEPEKGPDRPEQKLTQDESGASKADPQAERAAILRWLDTCRVEISSLTPGRCLASAGSDFRLQGVRSDWAPDQNSLSSDDLRALLPQARNRLESFSVTFSGANVNVEGAAAFVSFDLWAEGVKRSTGEKVSESHSVLLRLQKNFETWRPLWARLL